MENPAALLHSTFTSWNIHGKTPTEIRRDTPDMAEHRRATTWLNEIDDILNRMEADGRRVLSPRKSYPQWVKFLFLYDKSWGFPALLSDADLDMLYTFADMCRDYVPAIDTAKLKALSMYLTDLLRSLSLDDTMDKQTKLQARAVITHIQSFLANPSHISAIGFERYIDQLLGILVRIAASSSDKYRWRRHFDNFVYPFVVGNAAAISSHSLLQLLTGGNG